MRKTLVLGIVLVLSLSLVAATTTLAFADAKLVLVGSFGGAPVPGHDDVMVEFLDFRRSPYGKADCMMLSVLVDGEEWPILAATDNEELAELLDWMFGGMVPVVVVADDELEVWRRGRTLYAELTVQVGDVHPVYAEFKGCSGAAVRMVESETIPGLCEMTLSAITLDAVVTYVCGEDTVLAVGMVGPQFLWTVTPL